MVKGEERGGEGKKGMDVEGAGEGGRGHERNGW